MSDLQFAQGHRDRNWTPQLAWVYAQHQDKSYSISYLLRVYRGLRNAVAYSLSLGENNRVCSRFGPTLLISSRLYSTDYQGPY